MAGYLKTEHAVLRALPKGRYQGELWLLAVSGGADSMAMAEILYRWRRLLGVRLAVAHVHHGVDSSLHRDRAQDTVSEWAHRRGLLFFSNPREETGCRSEQELRRYRLRWLSRWFHANRFDRVVFAHHRDDLLETRLLRLIRGAGPQGLKAMAVERGKILRPVLHLSRAELREYARIQGLEWAEDPTNRSEQSLRNWLRHTWMPQLEKRSKGSLNSLARSLTTLSKDDFTETIGPYVGLRRVALEKAVPARREDIVARYLRALGVKGYSQSHVQELLKRLGSRENVCFKMLGFSFQMGPDFLWASRV